MTIMLDETLLATWFVKLKGHDDWIAGINKLAERRHKLTHRFRYADPVEPGANPWENIDRKSWYAGEFKGLSDTEVIARVNLIATELARAAGTSVAVLIREEGETTEAFAQRFMKQPHAHAQVAPPEGTPEYEKFLEEHPDLRNAINERKPPS